MTLASRRIWRDFLAQATPPIVVHLPRNLGGNAATLSNAMRSHGVSSISVSFDEDGFGFFPDLTICQPNDSRITKELRRIVWLCRILKHADILHFNSGTTLSMPSDETVRIPGQVSMLWRWLRIFHARYSETLQRVELFFAKRLGVTMFMTFQGDDLRQGDRSHSLFDISIAQRVPLNYYNPKSDANKRRLLLRLQQTGMKFFFLNPDLNWFLDGCGMFLPYSNVDIRKISRIRSPYSRDMISIVHAPSQRAAQGTETIRNAIDHLQNQGHTFEFKLVEHLNNKEARSIISSADLLIDQLFAGWYGGVAVEAMAHGVATMSYIRESDLAFVPTDLCEEMPIIRVDEATLVHKIEWYLGLSIEERLRLSAASTRYVARWHSPRSVAKTVIDVYRSSDLTQDFSACRSSS
jgi:hypothetical protein